MFILYKIPYKRTSIEWQNIKISKTQTFEDQTKQGRRPRINWDSLKNQIKLIYIVFFYKKQYDIIF